MCCSTIIDPAIQSMIFGLQMILDAPIKGGRIKSDDSTLKKSMAIIGFFAQALLGVYFVVLGGGKLFLKYTEGATTTDFFCKPNTINLSELSTLPQELDRNITSDVLKQNCLTLTTSYDPNGAFAYPFVRKSFELQCNNFWHTTVSSIEDICERIKRFSNYTGPVTKLVIEAHGLPDSISLSRNYAIFRDTTIPSDCFSNLAKDAHIYLDSCLTGAKMDFGIAAYIARSSQRSLTASYGLVNNYKSVIISDLNNPQDLSGGMRFFDIWSHFPQDFPNVLDQTVVCSPQGRCIYLKAIPKFIIFPLSYSFIQNTITLDLTGIKCLSIFSSLLATLLDKGVEIASPLSKKISYALVNPGQKPLIDKVGNGIYKISKISVFTFRSFGKVSALIDETVYYGFKTVAKILSFTGDHLEKAIDYLSSITPKSKYPLINLAGKVTKEVSRIPCKLLSWTGISLDGILT
jgi:hypothetical protein